MNPARLTIQATVILLFLFGILVFGMELRALKRAQLRINEHAVIIADDLWHYNRRGAAGYLSLAAAEHHYESLEVVDHSGEIFNRTGIGNTDWVERTLIRWKLIPRVNLMAHVEYNGNIIGWIEAVWIPQTLYFHLSVFFAFVLLVIIVHLVARVLSEKRLLEERVQERTAELLRSNVTLKQEVDERTRAEEALRASEEKHRLLAENITDVIWTAGMDLRFTYVSPVAQKMHGWGADEEIPFKTIYDVVTPASLKKAMRYIRENLEKGDRTGRYDQSVTAELEMYRADRSLFWTEVTASFIVDKDNKPIGILGVTRDITDRRKANLEKEELQQKLIRSKKMESLGLLAGGVAHDLNNVLSGIVSYPDLLLMDLSDDSPMREPIQTIKDSGLKAAHIVQDLLTLARRGVVAKEVVNLNDIITEYLASPEHQKMLSYHPEVSIIKQLENELPNIKGSPVHLRKSIMNLISNAAEAQPGGGVVTIATESRYLDRPITGYDTVKDGDYVVVRIEDQGEGIAESDLHRIFEPFYTKKVMGRSGTGLGMAVVWGTVQDNDGYIDIKSEVNVGTIFELYFPMTREDTGQEDGALLSEDLMGSGETVLVVDDVPDQRKIATRILEKLNYAVTAVSSGEAAAEYVREHPVDLVILDMIMEPGIDGLETYRRIIESCPHQKAIIASGFAETDRVREAQRLGAGEYIKKPYMMNNIGLAVKNELERGN